MWQKEPSFSALLRQVSFTRCSSFQLHPNDYQRSTGRPPGSQLRRRSLQKGWRLPCPGAAEGLEQSQGCPAQPMACCGLSWSPGAQEGRPATPSPWRPPSKNTARGLQPQASRKYKWITGQPGVGGWGHLAQEGTGPPLSCPIPCLCTPCPPAAASACVPSGVARLVAWPSSPGSSRSPLSLPCDSHDLPPSVGTGDAYGSGLAVLLLRIGACVGQVNDEAKKTMFH